MADEKEPKKVVSPRTESGELKKVEISRALHGLSVPFTPFAPIIPVLAGEEAARKTQLRFLKDDGKGFLAGETAEYAKAFDVAIKPLPVSDPKKRTSALLVVNESTDSDSDHAYNSSSVAYHAARVATGKNPPPVLRINRFIYPEDKQKINPHWMKNSTDEKNDYYFPNRVQAEEKALYRSHDYVIVSNSTHVNDASLVSEEARKKNVAYLRGYYGPNVILVSAAGNEYSSANSLSKLPHNSVHNDSRNLRVGAADKFTRKDQFGKEIIAYQMEDYSSVNANIVSLITPPDAKKPAPDRKPRRFAGTSAATPRIAGEVILPLVEEFGHSGKQKEKVHNADTVLAAVKLTAHPIWVREDQSVRKEEYRRADVVENALIGERFYSPQAGPGLVQPEHASALLKKQAEYAKLHPESNIPLVNKSYPQLLPKTHEKNKNGLYEYKINVTDDVLANSITLGLRSDKFFQKITSGSNQWEEAAKLFLVSPDGKQRLRVFPTKSGMEAKGYAIAETSGFLMTPAKGEWTLQSTVPVKEVNFSLDQAIPKGHFIDKVRPDFAKMRKEALQHADFSKVKGYQLKEMESIPLETFDLSQTILPDGYMNLRLLREVAHGRHDKAIALAKTNYRGFEKNRGDILKALEAKDFKKLIGVLEKDGKPQFNTFEMAMNTEDRTLIQALLKNGYADTRADKEDGKYKSDYSPAELLAGAYLPERAELLKLAFANGAKMDDRVLLRALERVGHYGKVDEDSVKVFKYLVEEQKADLDAKSGGILREPITFKLTGQPELLEYVIKRKPELRDAEADRGETLLQKVLSNYSADDRVKASLIKLAEMKVDLSGSAKYDKHGWLDDAIIAQQRVLKSKMMTSAQLLKHDLSKKPSETKPKEFQIKEATKGQADSWYKKAELPSDTASILLTPLPLSKEEKDKNKEVEVSITAKKEGQHIYLPLKDGTAQTYLRNLPKDAKVTLLIAPDDVSKLRFGSESRHVSVRIGTGAAHLSTAGEEEKGIDISHVMVSIGTAKDGKVSITHQLSLKELISKRDALLKAAHPGKEKGESKTKDSDLGLLVPNTRNFIGLLPSPPGGRIV